MTARVLPQAVEAEQQVIGACLVSEQAVETVLAALRPEHFYRMAHGKILEAIRSVHGRQEGVDALTVARELERTHELEGLSQFGGESGGRAYLAQLGATTYMTTNVAHHAAIVREMWGKRQCIASFTAPMTGLWNGSKPDEAIKEVERALIELRGLVEDDGQSRTVSGHEAAEWMFEFIASPPDRKAGIPTPFSFLPRFQPGRLYVLGGYPADGKTAISVQFLRAALIERKRVGFVSIEMSWEDLTMRLISSFGIPYGPLQDGVVMPGLQAVFDRALTEISSYPVDLIDDSTVDAGEIARYQRVGRYDYLVIDYLQRIDYADRFELNRQVKAITTLARTAKVPILLLSQFSRPQNVVGFPRPTMKSFAETSVIEKEAALAMAIWRHRDEFQEPTEESEFLLMKNRYGPPGRRSLRFRPDEVRFVELAR